MTPAKISRLLLLVLAGPLAGLVWALHAVLVLVAFPRPAFADTDGAWELSPVAETFTVQSWGPSCGLPPKSDTLFPGAQVSVKTDGGELVVTGGARTLRTDQCIDPMPTLVRASHSSDGRSWRTSCKTPANDARYAEVNAAYFLFPDAGSIALAETGRYSFTINGVHCVADVSRSATLTRLAASPPPATTGTIPTQAPTPVATSAPSSPKPAPVEAKADCSSPGQPARLEVRPSRKLLKLGDTFAFHAEVLDADGCRTAIPIAWTVGAVTFKDGQPYPAQPSVDASGKLSVPGSDFADAKFDVVATAAGKNARAGVEVTTPADFAALLAQSGLDSNGERDEPAVAVIATTAIGAGGAQAEDGAARRRLVFISVIVGLSLVLGIVAAVGVARTSKAQAVQAAAERRHAQRMEEYERAKRDREAAYAVQMKRFQESVAIAQQQAAAATARGIDTGPMFCLSCRREQPAGNAFCPFDANPLVTVRGHGELMNGPPGAVCPACRHGYNPGVKTCPRDGEELVPAASIPPIAAAPGRKICPRCGDHRGNGAHEFCGKDGSQLVMLN